MNTTAIRVSGRTRYYVKAKAKPTTPMSWKQIVLLFLVFVSAFSVIYCRDFNRRMFISYQQLQSMHNQLYVDYGKLLLEQGTWSSQRRVQNISENQLGMVLPDRKYSRVVKI